MPLQPNQTATLRSSPHVVMRAINSANIHVRAMPRNFLCFQRSLYKSESMPTYSGTPCIMIKRIVIFQKHNFQSLSSISRIFETIAVSKKVKWTKNCSFECSTGTNVIFLKFDSYQEIFRKNLFKNEESEIEEHPLSYMLKLERYASAETLDDTLIFKVEDNLENDENMRILSTNATEQLEDYKCNVCAETFVLVAFSCSSSVMEHLKTHSHDRLHECSICNLRSKSRQLKTAEDLYLHLQMHSDDRPYASYLCCSTPRRKDQLNEHRNIHTKEERYKCKICNQTYTRNLALQRHRTSHSGRLYTCFN
ncbi:hypothetical protein HUJ04_008265 [Dendroctonus ponderosae]|nr:hypothetical protein HUJ04_008265 [Dendroctonus ponderosae]